MIDLCISHGLEIVSGLGFWKVEARSTYIFASEIVACVMQCFGDLATLLLIDTLLRWPLATH